MELQIVGFRAGAPLGGGCSCYAVRSEETSLLLDLGPGAVERLWENDAVARLDAIVISHMHMDHVLDVLPLSSEITRAAWHERYGKRRRLPSLYVPRDGGLAALDALARAVGSSFDRFTASFELQEYDDRDRVTVGDLTLTFAPTIHPVPCYAPRITDGRASLVYGADGAHNESVVAHAAGADLLLLESTFLDAGPDADRHGHITGEQAGSIAQGAGAKRLLLTHYGPWPDLNEENLRRASAQFDGPVELVREGAVYRAICSAQSDPPQ